MKKGYLPLGRTRVLTVRIKARESEHDSQVLQQDRTVRRQQEAQVSIGGDAGNNARTPSIDNRHETSGYG